MKILKVIIFSCLLLSGALFSHFAHGDARQDRYNFFKEFVEVTCCYTNDCCWEIQPNEVTDLGNNHYRINSTGQVVVRKAYSPDGKYYRCACDPVYSEGGQSVDHWNKHQGANTRCLYTPQQLF